MVAREREGERGGGGGEREREGEREGRWSPGVVTVIFCCFVRIVIFIIGLFYRIK